MSDNPTKNGAAERGKKERKRRPRCAIPRHVYRELMLGEFSDVPGHITVVAGHTLNWWEPDFMLRPEMVDAKIIRLKGAVTR